MLYDTLIRNALVIDGSNTPGYAADVAILDGRIAHIGDPADEIVRTASEGHFDLVVMGTHGHTALANLVIGSVATKVLARSMVPVMFMKA